MLKPINIVVAVLSVAVIFLGYMVLFQDSNGQPSIEEQREQRQRDIRRQNAEDAEERGKCYSVGGTYGLEGICHWPTAIPHIPLK